MFNKQLLYLTETSSLLFVAAKMLDYLQEDLDSMQKELEMWRSENKQLTQTLKREQRYHHKYILLVRYFHKAAGIKMTDTSIHVL